MGLRDLVRNIEYGSWVLVTVEGALDRVLSEGLPLAIYYVGNNVAETIDESRTLVGPPGAPRQARARHCKKGPPSTGRFQAALSGDVERRAIKIDA